MKQSLGAQAVCGRASPSSIEQILRTASPQVRAICLSLLRQLAKAKEKK